MHSKRFQIFFLAAMLLSGLSLAEPISIKAALEKCSCDTKPVEVVGNYQGWSGSCKDSGMKTRSDWILTDATGCIFVSKIRPKRLNPHAATTQTFRVTGMLRENNHGDVYLEATHVTPVKP